MKNMILVSVVLIVGISSSSSFAKEVQKRKVVVISFSESDTKSRLPASLDEVQVLQAQARHVASERALDKALENLD